jgi:hypothetical protein
VCARLWIRHKNHGLAADDWMAILSMVFALIYSIMCIVRTCIPPAFSPPPHPSLTVCSESRDQIWPGSSARPAPQGQPDTLHARQLRRPADLPAGHQLLQGRAVNQLPAALQGDEPCHLPQGGLDFDGGHRRGAPGMRACPDPRVHAGKSALVRDSTLPSHAR